MAKRSVTEALCQRIVDTKSGDPSEEVRARVRKPTRAVIGFGFETTAAQAAYVNGSSMHVLDVEPRWSPANHSLSTTVPAVLALVEQRALARRGVATALAGPSIDRLVGFAAAMDALGTQGIRELMDIAAVRRALAAVNRRAIRARGVYRISGPSRGLFPLPQ